MAFVHQPTKEDGERIDVWLNYFNVIVKTQKIFLEKLSHLKKWLQVKHLAMSQEVPGMPGVTSETTKRQQQRIQLGRNKNMHGLYQTL